MSTYSRVNYGEVEPVSGAMHLLAEPLDSDRLGVTVAQCDPHWTSRPHDHGDDDHEEIYLLIEGEATVVVDGEPVALEAGDAVRIEPDATRQIKNGAGESVFVLISAAECRRSSSGAPRWPVDSFQG